MVNYVFVCDYDPIILIIKWISYDTLFLEGGVPHILAVNPLGVNIPQLDGEVWWGGGGGGGGGGENTEMQ